MKGFSPVKKHARNFNYNPRFYDPAKQARDERRAELRGTTSATDNEEYEPGNYLKRQREARAASRLSRRKNPFSGFTAKIMVFAMILLLAYILVPRIFDAFQTSGNEHESSTVDMSGGFDASANYTIVPNDYDAANAEDYTVEDYYNNGESE